MATLEHLENRIDSLATDVRDLQNNYPSSKFDAVFRSMLAIIPVDVPKRLFYASVAAYRAVHPVSIKELAAITGLHREHLGDAVRWLSQNILDFKEEADALAYLDAEMPL